MAELNTSKIELNCNTEELTEADTKSSILGDSENIENIEKQLILDEILKIDEISISSAVNIDGNLNNQNKLNEGNHFISLINNLLLNKNHNDINLFFEDCKNIELLKEFTFDVVPICVKYLTDINYKKDLTLFVCAENLLKLIAENASPDEVQFELLEIIETTKSDNTLTSVLKALQICLQRQKDKRPRSLEWALNSIINFINYLPIPDYLTKGYDARQERLLEQNDLIDRILTNYITLTLFYEPLYNELIELNEESDNCSKNQIVRKKIFICFILKLLGKPLALLDLSNNKKSKKNTYSLQCAATFTKHLSIIIGDPFHLLHYVQLRCNLTKKSANNELDTNDYFMVNEQCPLLSIAIYYYMVICEEVTLENTPKIYDPMYIFNSCLYLTIELLNCKEPNIQHKGINLGNKIIEYINGIPLTIHNVQLKVHLNFYTSLINIIIFSNLERSRESGMLLFQNYFDQLDDCAKFYILKKLIKTTKHNGFLGYLMVSYKNLIDKQLKNHDSTLSENFCGTQFKKILLNYICKLNNIETDFTVNYDQIISALNIVRYFLIADKKNRTGFWNFLDEIKKTFLEPLRLRIHLSRTNYKIEESRILSGKIIPNEQSIQLSLLNGEDLPIFTKEQKLKMMSSALINLDLMESLLARVNECIDNNSIKNINKNLKI